LTGLGTGRRRAADGSGVAERRRNWRLWPPEISWSGPAALAARPGAGSWASLTPAGLWRNHRLFTVTALVSVLPRVIAALGFAPALLIQDSFSYMAEGAHLTPLSQLRPAGYPLLLWVLRPFHSLLLVTTLQHLMGIALAAIVYGVLRSRGLPAWGATLAAAPTLFDSREIWMESSILPDTLFTLVLMIAVAILILVPRPAIWQVAVVGVLVSWASVIRGNGAPVFLVILVFLLVRRVGWRVITACVIAFAIPLLGYALLFFSEYGQFDITNSTGLFLWSRTMSFANCAVIKPPADLVPLCPQNQPDHPTGPAPAWSVSALLAERTPADYLWASGAWYLVDKHPGINAYNNNLATEFAERAIAAQPLDYARTVGEGVLLTFIATDRSQSYLTLHFTATPYIPALDRFQATDEYLYAHTGSNTRAIQPWAYLMLAYQEPVWFPGVVFLLVMIGGLAGLAGLIGRRGARGEYGGYRGYRGYAALAWGVALVNLVIPIAAHEMDYRYAISAVPFACLALGLVLVRRPVPGAAADRPVPEDRGAAAS
jgi:hypothetical protein